MTNQKPPLSQLIDNDFNDMVTKMASKLAAKYHNNPMISAGDLEGEAMVATVRAYDNFDPSREVKFRTYAFTYVRRSMEQFCLRNIFKLSASTTDLRERFGEVQKANSGMVNIDDIDIAEHSSPTGDLEVDEYFLAGLEPRHQNMAKDRFLFDMNMDDMAVKYDMSISGIEQTLKKIKGTLQRRGRRYESCDS